MSFYDLKTNLKYFKLRKYFPFLFFLLVLPFSLLAVYQGAKLFGFAKKPSESIPLHPNDNATQPEYKDNEIILKLKNKNLVIKKEIESKDNVFDKQPVDFNSLDQEENPLILQTINQKSKIKQIDKVFKETDDSQQELSQKKHINKEKFMEIDLSNIYKITFSDKVNLQDIITQISLSPDVEWAEPNYIFTTQLLTNDPFLLDPDPISIERDLPINQGGWNPLNNDGSFLDYQWNLKKINIPQAWEITQGSEEIQIGIVDSGVDCYHRELLDVCLPGYDYVNSDDDPMDDLGHGTHVAGIINSLSNNGIGIGGISWQSKIIPIKVFDDKGSGTLDKVSLGIVDVVNRGADVVNMSFGISYPISTIPNTLALALDYLYSNGVVAVAAAGNNNDDLEKGYWPANYNTVISVAASDQNDKRTSFSNYGNDLLVTAPGGQGREFDGDNYSGRNILSLQSNNRGNPVDMNDGGSLVGKENKYLRARGTSMAAPHVTGLVALILAKRSDLLGQPDLVRNIVANGAEDIGEPGFDSYSGYGRINAFKTLTELNTGSLPMANITSPVKNLPLNPKFKVMIKGTATALNFEKYLLGYYPVDKPEEKQVITQGNFIIDNGLLGTWQGEIQTGKYVLELSVYYDSGKIRKNSINIDVDKNLKIGFPLDLGSRIIESPVAVDLNQDGKQEIITATVEGNVDIYNFDGSKFTPWPEKKFQNSSIDTTPAVGNLDSDTDLEFIFGVYSNETMNRSIYAFNYDGTLVSGNWPLIEPKLLSSISLSDLNKDNQDEVIGFYYSPPSVVVWQANGNLYSGNWPAKLDSNVFYTYPVIANLDNSPDNSLEIIVQSAQHLSIFKSNGDLIASVVLNNYTIDSTQTPAVGDIDSDGKKEILIYDARLLNSQYQEIIAVYRFDGKEIVNLGFPIGLKKTPEPASSLASISLTNSDGDPQLEILSRNILFDHNGSFLVRLKTESDFPIVNLISGDVNNDSVKEFFGQNILGNELFLYGWRRNGSYLPGFPKPLQNNTSDGLFFVQRNTPLLTDLDNDGKTDLITTNNGYLYAYNISEIPNKGFLDWPMYLHDVKHTSTYQTSKSSFSCGSCPNLIEPRNNELWCRKKDQCGCYVWVLCKNVVITSMP